MHCTWRQGATDTGGFVSLSTGASKAHSLLLYMAMMSGELSFKWHIQYVTLQAVSGHNCPCFASKIGWCKRSVLVRLGHAWGVNHRHLWSFQPWCCCQPVCVYVYLLSVKAACKESIIMRKWSSAKSVQEAEMEAEATLSPYVTLLGHTINILDNEVDCLVVLFLKTLKFKECYY